MKSLLLYLYTTSMYAFSDKSDHQWASNIKKRKINTLRDVNLKTVSHQYGLIEINYILQESNCTIIQKIFLQDSDKLHETMNEFDTFMVNVGLVFQYKIPCVVIWQINTILSKSTYQFTIVFLNSNHYYFWTG